MKKFYFLLILILPFGFLNAAVRLPAIIGSHMVLQQKSTVKLWGWAAPSEKITITVGWDTSTYQTTTTNGARWETEIKTPNAGGPYSIHIKASNDLVLEDVLIGEVWLCGGQSNMEWSGDQGLQQSKDESPNATNKQIRFFYIPKSTSQTLQDNVDAKWIVCNTEDMLHFSAIGYFFGKKINQMLNIPVGLINCNWGGTPAEVWTPKEIVNNDPELKAASDKIKPAAWWPNEPGLSFDAMVFPITQFKIAGTIWYQGESNVTTNSTYEKLFTRMIDGWRKAWNNDFPFYFVQIAPFSYGDDNVNGALLREAQTKASLHAGTGMVVVSDLVDDIKNIHPKAKKEVGERLANYALAETYGIKNLVYKSPIYKSYQLEKGKLRIQFDNVPTKLISKNGPPTEFYIAGADNKFVPATAKIEGNTILVYNKEIKEPKAVRFGFTNTSIPNLFSAEGLPVNLFRIDSIN